MNSDDDKVELAARTFSTTDDTKSACCTETMSESGASKELSCVPVINDCAGNGASGCLEEKHDCSPIEGKCETKDGAAVESCIQTVKAGGDTERSTVEECDPYFYTKRDEFTSEVFKIEIEGLPRVAGYNQVKQLLTRKMNLKTHKIKVTNVKKKCPQFIFATFRCEEDREMAIKTISNYVWKGHTLSAKKANPMADPLVKKRRAEQNRDCEDAKKPKKDINSKLGQVDGANTEDTPKLPVSVMVQNAVTPLWHLPYDVQLKDKQQELVDFMKKLTKGVKNINPHLIPKDLQIEGSELCCPVLPILASPETTGYRNKCEFNVGLDPESELPTVGFRISSYKEGSMSVAEASHCSNVPPLMQEAAKLFQKYIRESALAVFNPETHEGYWRQLTARTSRKEHMLLIVVLHPQTLTEEEVIEEKTKLSHIFSTSDLKVTSLYLQRFVKRQQNEPPLEHVWGTTFVEEELLGLTFRISPDAFFQVNTLGAQLLYTTVQDFASLTKETTLLDLCCGTGAIGISLAKGVKKVIGVELCLAAVEDARYNVEANGIDNAEFICGKVEDVTMSVFKRIRDDEDVVAILDPPRAGLPSKLIKMIRGMDRLKRLVYLSCSPQLAFTNFIDLCRPISNNYRGSPFRPMKAVAMDLFPHTKHWELVVLFERK